MLERPAHGKDGEIAQGEKYAEVDPRAGFLQAVGQFEEKKLLQRKGLPKLVFGLRRMVVKHPPNRPTGWNEDPRRFAVRQKDLVAGGGWDDRGPLDSASPFGISFFQSSFQGAWSLGVPVRTSPG
jgi:hypothetical protein